MTKKSLRRIRNGALPQTPLRALKALRTHNTSFIKSVLSVLLAVLTVLPLTACWDHVEISKMLIIAGIGLDTDASGKRYFATVEFVNATGDDGKNATAAITEGEGDSLHDAIQNALLLTGGDIFGNHCKAVVIGEDLARNGISRVVEMILRSPDYRKTVDILIAKDSTAKELLKQKTVKNDIVSYELSKILSSNEKSIRNTVATGVYQIHEALLSDCPFFVTPAVYSRENNGEDNLQVDGCAIFGEDRLLGFLDGDQSKLFQLIARNNGSITMPVQDVSLPEAPIDVSVTRNNVRLYPGLNGSTPSMRVAISAEATLADAVLSEMKPSVPQTAEELRNTINHSLSRSVKEFINEVQSQYGADVFGFYREYQDKYRREWPELQKDWPTHFREMEITVDSNVKITGSGLIGNYSPEADTGNAIP